MKKFLIVVSIALFPFMKEAMAQTNLADKLASLGISKENCKDWSDSTDIELPMPTCAYVNVTDIPRMPRTWGVNYHGWMEVYDGNGNYFKKRIIIDLQGRSSTSYSKKNFKVDFCNDEWLAEDTPDIKFGNWVEQDGFHFKAFYLDFFRGTGIMGYKIYDQLTIGRGETGRIWERYNLKKPDPEALCHPDAFPCVVYLNGDFWGIYAFQLKKHRKNMNMKKNTLEHIHLDGTPKLVTFLSGGNNWTCFEIRNPKNLYRMDGTPYDGDHIGELIDETSPYFDLETDDEETRQRKQNTVVVKNYLLRLNNNIRDIEALGANHASVSEIKAAIEERFDIPSLCDYIIHNLLTNNLDGLQRNYQWGTYDGNKWFVVPYDLDATFGYHPVTYIIFPPRNYALGSLTSRKFTSYGPLRWADAYYRQDIYARYAYLRNSGLLNGETVASFFSNWYYSIGESNMQDEMIKWPNSPSFKETIPNEQWKLIPFSEYNYTLYSSYPIYKETTTYQPGDRCTTQYRVWEAKETTKGVLPYAQVGSKDSLDRIEPWVTEHLIYLDQWMHYSFESYPRSYTLQISSIGWATLCLPFQFVVPEGLTLYTVKGRDSEGRLIKEQVTIPEANKPYLVKGPTGSYMLSGYSEEDNEMADDHLANYCLRGCYADRYVPKDCYVLQNHNGHVAFYQVKENGTVKTAANKAWLHFDNSDDVPAYALDFADDDVPSSISLMQESPEIVGTYSVDGANTHGMIKGVNVVKYSDGTTKKVIIK